jgi:hypothetical protein
MTMFVTPDMPAVAKLFGQAQQYALAHGLPLAQAKALAAAQLMGQIQMSAAVRAFDDCFLLAAAACVVGIGPAMFLKGSPRVTSGAGAGRHEPVEV